MKKKILILTTSLVLILSASYARSSANPVPKYLSTAFANDFSRARDIQWESYNGYYKVSFEDMGKAAYAYYTKAGEFMGFAVHLSADKLPVALRTMINEQYPGYWITELYQFTIDTTAGFFVTLENADRKIMLKAEAGETWSLFAQEKKADL
ncbi:MAG TPA: hypothetical protein VII28_17320 [Puia sp.]